MDILRAIVDRAVLLTLIVAAGAAPSYIQQYRQQVAGRLAQVESDLAGFEALAARRHGGDMRALIAHHLASDDATFRGEGVVIERMLTRADALRETYAALDAPLARQAWYLARHADAEIARSTWSIYDPAFVLTPAGIVFALVVGVGAWLILFGLWRLLAALGRSLTPARSAAR